jgi:hypothetical protein
MHRTARLFEIYGFESRCRASDRPKMPLGFLNEVKQRVSVRIGRGQRRRERALNRDKGGCQMTPMVGRACWRAEVSQAFGRVANPFASGLDRLVVDDCTGAGDRALQQESGKLDQTPTQEIMQRSGFGDIARERVDLTQSARSSMSLAGPALRVRRTLAQRRDACTVVASRRALPLR